MAESVNTESDQKYQTVRGVLFPGPQWFPRQRLEDILDYMPHDGDVIIASYPKTGTTWMQYIVLQIISRGESFSSFNDVLHKFAPFMEMTGVDTIEELKEPRIYKHHCPYNLMQKNPKAKYIYTYRLPEDTFVSYFHFMQSAGHHGTMDFNQYFEDFLSGNVGYSRYFEHVLSYFAHKHNPGLLLVSYEKLSSSKREEILRIAKFLGDEYYQDLIKDEEIMKKIMEHTSFEYMKQNLVLEFPKNPKDPTSEGEPAPDGPPEEEEMHKINFFRKGVVGDGKESLSEEQLERLRKLMIEIVQDQRLLDEWL